MTPPPPAPSKMTSLTVANADGLLPSLVVAKQVPLQPPFPVSSSVPIVLLVRMVVTLLRPKYSYETAFGRIVAPVTVVAEAGLSAAARSRAATAPRRRRMRLWDD